MKTGVRGIDKSENSQQLSTIRIRKIATIKGTASFDENSV
jgi:hypothetical protein